MHKLLLIAVTLVLLFNIQGCAENQKSSLEESDNGPVDSILGWIDNGRSADYTLIERDRFLNKAYANLDRISNDSAKTKYLSELSLAYSELPDSLMFKLTNRETLILAAKVNDSVALAEAHWDLADFFNLNSKPDSAFYHYSQAHKFFSQLGDDFLSGRILYNMAGIQADAKDYTGSEINTIRAIELFLPLEKNLHLYYCYNNLGSITKELEEYDRALEYYEEARTYQQKIKEKNIFGHSLENNVGVVYQEMGEHRKALTHFDRVIADTTLPLKNSRLYARTINNRAYSQHKLNMKADLTGEFKNAIAIMDSIEDWQGIARAHYNGAEYYRDLNDTVHAMAHANLAMEYALRSKNNKRLLQTMELLASLDPDNAAEHAKAYIRLDDSLQREERAIRNKFARIRFETDEFIAQNELLARQRQLWIGIAGGMFLLTFSVFIIVIQRVKNQRLKFQQQQQESNQEIFNLMMAQNQKLEEGKQSEQKRISEELHDGILGEMNGVRMVLLGLNKKMDEAAISLRAQAITKLQEIQEEIRTISHELSDASYRKFHNFVISLQDLLKNTGDAAGIGHEMTYDEDIDWDALTGDVKINLYRVVQECLQNSVKHARANTISLNLHGNTRHIVITVADDGMGFQAQGGKKGIGHKNISSRVQKLGGVWDVSSAKGKGTTITIKIPYSEMDMKGGRSALRKGKLQEA
jgi:two-component system, NarL family, sensor kinase